MTPRAHLLVAALRARIAAGLEPGDERALLRAELQAALAQAGTKAGAALVLGCSRPTLDEWLELAGVDARRGWRTG